MTETATTIRTGPVCVDELGPFTARYDLAERWNGWLCPSFTRAEAERIIRTLEEKGWNYPRTLEGDTFRWEGDVLIVDSPQYHDDPAYVPERIAPDGDGLYLMALGWVWSEFEPTGPTAEEVIASYDALIRSNRTADWDTVAAVAYCDNGLYGALGEVWDEAERRGYGEPDDALEDAFVEYQKRLRVEADRDHVHEASPGSRTYPICRTCGADLPTPEFQVLVHLNRMVRAGDEEAAVRMARSELVALGVDPDDIADVEAI